jgi:hypothetical protein
MGIQRLNDKKVARIAQVTGLPLVKAAVGSAGNPIEVVTDTDEHWLYDRFTHEVEPTTGHWSSCREDFAGSAP